MKYRKAPTLIACGVATCFITAAAAFACTTTTGSTFITGNPTSLARGANFTATATSAQANQTDYKLTFLNLSSDDDGMGGCHPVASPQIAPQDLVTGVSSNGSGAIASTSATIPSGAQRTDNDANNSALICFTQVTGNPTFGVFVEIT